MDKKISIKSIIYFASVILLIGVFPGCSNPGVKNNEAGYSVITPEEAKERLDNEKGIILLDVRTKEEYESGHIRNSILIPVDNVKEEAPKNLKNKEAVIFIYCRSGNRSASAADILVKLGYKNVYDLGGIKDWPYEVVK